ncbi:MAG: HAD family hydrolase [Candidatus Binatia bacterium]
MLRALIFDFNGIIVDDEPIHFRLFQKVLGEEGILLTEEAYYARYLGFDDRGAFTAGFRENQRPIDDAKLKQLIARKAIYYRGAIRNHVAIFPGVQSLVSTLAQTHPLAVASGALRNEIETILKTAGLLNHFQAIVSAEDVTKGKPEPEIFLKALAALNSQKRNGATLTAGDCLVIEDSKEGIRGARRAGMKCLAVTNSHAAELLGEADAIVPSLEEVTLPFLQKLCA